MKKRLDPTLLATIAVFVVLFTLASVFYSGFLSWRVGLGLLSDNAVVGIAAVGATLVIFTGGIDLSIGGTVGCVSVLTASLIQRHGLAAPEAWLLILVLGSLFGLFMGVLIQCFELPPFLVTLAGMFLARGIGFWIATDSIPIGGGFYTTVADFGLRLGSARLASSGVILVAFIVVAYVVAHRTRFGRTLIAIGGSESSAVLMGLPVARSKIAVYVISSLCASAAGIVSTIYTSSGNPSGGVGLELDAIAIVVIGGTLLSGGRGSIFGTLFGVLIFGTIQSAILFDGRLSSWWMRIVVGGLLLAFILVQRFFSARTTIR
jgi:ribose/xylose/arabinose/galactoside ABC-type transport system permease subunit